MPRAFDSHSLLTGVTEVSGGASDDSDERERRASAAAAAATTTPAAMSQRLIMVLPGQVQIRFRLSVKRPASRLRHASANCQVAMR